MILNSQNYRIDGLCPWDDSLICLEAIDAEGNGTEEYDAFEISDLEPDLLKKLEEEKPDDSIFWMDGPVPTT